MSFTHSVLPLNGHLTTVDGIRPNHHSFQSLKFSFSDSVLNVVGRLLHLPEEAALVLRAHELSLIPNFSSILADITLDISAPDRPRPTLAISRRLRGYAEKVACVLLLGL